MNITRNVLYYAPLDGDLTYWECKEYLLHNTNRLYQYSSSLSNSWLPIGYKLGLSARQLDNIRGSYTSNEGRYQSVLHSALLARRDPAIIVNVLTKFDKNIGETLQQLDNEGILLVRPGKFDSREVVNYKLQALQCFVDELYQQEKEMVNSTNMLTRKVFELEQEFKPCLAQMQHQINVLGQDNHDKQDQIDDLKRCIMTLKQEGDVQRLSMILIGIFLVVIMLLLLKNLLL